MRIAVLSRACYPFHGHGGLERHVFDLVHHLIARDIRVTLVTPPDRKTRRPAGGGTGPDGLAAPTAEPRREPVHDAESVARRVFEDPRCLRHVVPYRTFPLAGRRGTTVLDRSTAYPLFGRRAGRFVADLVERGEIDLVYGLGASALGYARARRGGAQAPFVFNPQGLEEFGATGAGQGGWLKRTGYAPLRAAVRACAEAADRVIATDRVLEPVVLRHLRVPASRVRVVPNAIDVEACDREAGSQDGQRIRAQHRVGADESVLLSVGRLEANKGFHVLAAALGRLLADDSAHARHGRRAARVRWVIVGDGPFRPSLDRVIDSAGLRDRVLFAGRVREADLHAWYEAATLFVHPTLYEGSSLVTLEAMAHRRAVVATLAGGLPDKVRPGVSGWLVPPGDADALGRAIREALDGPRDRLAAMGHEGRAIAIAGFSWPHVIDRFLDVCTETLAVDGRW